MNKRLILLRALSRKMGNLAQLRDTQPPKQGWISAVRQALGLTAKQLAERVGLSQPRIAKMELNENNLKISTMKKSRKDLTAISFTVLFPRAACKKRLTDRPAKRPRRFYRMSIRTWLWKTSLPMIRTF